MNLKQLPGQSNHVNETMVGFQCKLNQINQINQQSTQIQSNHVNNHINPQNQSINQLPRQYHNRIVSLVPMVFHIGIIDLINNVPIIDIGAIDLINNRSNN